MDDSIDIPLYFKPIHIFYFQYSHVYSFLNLKLINNIVKGSQFKVSLKITKRKSQLIKLDFELVGGLGASYAIQLKHFKYTLRVHLLLLFSYTVFGHIVCNCTPNIKIHKQQKCPSISDGPSITEVSIHYRWFKYNIQA